MSNKNNFFPSLKGDKGLTVKKNKKKQLTLSFIGDKGPLNVILDKENSDLFVDYILEITKEETTNKNPMPFVNKFIESSKNIHRDQIEPTLTKIDTKDHPFIHGYNAKINDSLTGEN